MVERADVLPLTCDSRPFRCPVRSVFFGSATGYTGWQNLGSERKVQIPWSFERLIRIVFGLLSVTAFLEFALDTHLFLLYYLSMVDEMEEGDENDAL